MESGGLVMVLIAGAGLVALVSGCVAYLYFGRLWFRAHVKGCPVPLGRMISMTLGGASAFRIVNAYVDAHLAGFEIALDDFEAHDLARGEVREVVRSMVRAKEAGADLSFDQARALDLPGTEIREEPNSLS